MAGVWDGFFSSAISKANSDSAGTGGIFGQGESAQRVSTNQSGSSVINNMSPQAMLMLKLLLKNHGDSILSGADTSETDYSKEAAKKDSEAAIKQIMQGLTSQALPSIANSAGAAGVYGSTSETLGANKAVADSAQQAAEMQGNVIASYGSSLQALKDTTVQNFLRGIQTAKGATEVTNTSASSQVDNETDASGLGGLVNGVFGKIGGLFS